MLQLEMLTGFKELIKLQNQKSKLKIFMKGEGIKVKILKKEADQKRDKENRRKKRKKRKRKSIKGAVPNLMKKKR